MSRKKVKQGFLPAPVKTSSATQTMQFWRRITCHDGTSTTGYRVVDVWAPDIVTAEHLARRAGYVIATEK